MSTHTYKHIYTHTYKPPPPPVVAMLQFHWRILLLGSLENLSSPSHIHTTRIHSHSSPYGQHTPLEKSPNHSLQHGTPVHSHWLAFTRWNIPEKREKTPGCHKFLFFHFPFPLRSIPLVRVKTNSSHLPTGKTLHCITQTSLLSLKISCEQHIGVTDTPHPTPHLAPPIGLLCVKV